MRNYKIFEAAFPTVPIVWSSSLICYFSGLAIRENYYYWA